MNSFRHGISN